MIAALMVLQIGLNGINEAGRWVIFPLDILVVLLPTRLLDSLSCLYLCIAFRSLCASTRRSYILGTMLVWGNLGSRTPNWRM